MSVNLSLLLEYVITWEWPYRTLGSEFGSRHPFPETGSRISTDDIYPASLRPPTINNAIKKLN